MEAFRRGSDIIEIIIIELQFIKINNIIVRIYKKRGDLKLISRKFNEEK